MEKIIFSYLLKQQPGVVHGCSTNAFGPQRISSEVYPQNTPYVKSFFNALKIPFDRTVMMRQEHGNLIKRVGEEEAGSGRHPVTYLEGVDGIYTGEKDVYLVIHTADCVPILIYDPKNRIVAAAHAGWPGTVKLIGQKMVERLAAECNSQPKDLICYLGPAIGPCCYANNHNQERLELFQQTFPKEAGVIKEKDGDFTVNLKSANLWQLREAGVLEENIEICGLCTYCRDDLFPSHRREKESRDSNILAVIGMKT